jgi:phage tail-like protein
MVGVGFAVTSRTDPLRNFKFQVQIIHPDTKLNVLNMGFTNVAGLNMTTEVIPYREGGWNTNAHKLPGQTDFGPITLIQGVVSTQNGMWNWPRPCSPSSGEGSLPENEQGSRQRSGSPLSIRILDHPITSGPASGSPAATQPSDGARVAFNVRDCWVGSAAFNDLDAGGNAVLISQMTMHHEGLDVLFGKGPASGLNVSGTAR